ncbi:MAG TPA: GAF domain-containing protein [Solirubrobacterales bacterium]|nr:GAF domain-containing protein [Solirubrobacterales bacterium]
MTAVSLLARPESGDLADHLSSEELSRLLEVSHGLNGSLDFKLVLQKVVSASRDLLGTDISTLLLLDEARELLTVEAYAGIDASVARRLSTPLGENIAGRVAATGVPARCSDIALDERSTLAGVCDGYIRSALLVPLVRNGQVVGVLGVETAELRKFDDHDEGILQLLADHAACAIETARLYSVEHDQVEQLQILVERVNSQNDVMRRSREAHDRLAEAALEGSGLTTLMGVLTELVPAPLAMVNQFGARLRASACGEDERAEQLWATCQANHRFGRNLERLRVNAGLASPAADPKEGFWRIVPVVAAGEVLGAIVVLDHEALEEQHMLILEEASSIMATELLRERSIAEVEARSHGDLLQTLLSAEVETAGIQERAALLGHDLTEEQAVVAVVPVNGSELPEPSVITSAGRRAVARAGLRGLYGTVDGCAVVLLSGGDRSLCREGAERWIAAFREELRGRSQAVELHFGVSEIPCAGREVREGFAQARQAAAMCRLSEGQVVSCFEDVQLIATLIDITNDEAIERYIERTIGRLEEYDGRKRTHLALTLETYLDCSGVARHAAKALYLHPHSLRYRLRRITEIQGIDLADPMARLTSHLALKLRAIVAPSH